MQTLADGDTSRCAAFVRLGGELIRTRWRVLLGLEAILGILGLAWALTRPGPSEGQAVLKPPDPSLFSDPALAQAMAGGLALVPSEVIHSRRAERGSAPSLSRRGRKTVEVTTQVRPDLRRRGGRVFFFGYRERDLVDGEPKPTAVPIDYGRLEPDKISRTGRSTSVEWADGMYYQLVYSVGVTPESGSPASAVRLFSGETELVFVLDDGKRRKGKGHKKKR